MDDVNLIEAATQYLATPKVGRDPGAASEVNRFVRWYGGDRRVEELRGHEISLYADSIGTSTPDAGRRAEFVRSFLSFLKKEGLTTANLGNHLRLRKTTQAAVPGRKSPEEALTADGIARLEAELNSLKELRPQAAEELKLARQDKDFRENAPLDAAKDKQAHLEGRIRELEMKLRMSVALDRHDKPANKIDVGSSVLLRNLEDDVLLRCIIVSPTEANFAAGRISNASPVGRALMERHEGEEIHVSVPAGVMRYRVEEILG